MFSDRQLPALLSLLNETERPLSEVSSGFVAQLATGHRSDVFLGGSALALLLQDPFLHPLQRLVAYYVLLDLFRPATPSASASGAAIPAPMTLEAHPFYSVLLHHADTEPLDACQAFLVSLLQKGPMEFEGKTAHEVLVSFTASPSLAAPGATSGVGVGDAAPSASPDPSAVTGLGSSGTQNTSTTIASSSVSPMRASSRHISSSLPRPLPPLSPMGAFRDAGLPARVMCPELGFPPTAIERESESFSMAGPIASGAVGASPSMGPATPPGANPAMVMGVGTQPMGPAATVGNAVGVGVGVGMGCGRRCRGGGCGRRGRGCAERGCGNAVGCPTGTDSS